MGLYVKKLNDRFDDNIKMLLASDKNYIPDFHEKNKYFVI